MWYWQTVALPGAEQAAEQAAAQAAEQAMARQQWAQARQLLRQPAASSGVQSSRALAMLARVEWHQGQKAKSDATARLAAQRGAQDPQTWHLLALYFAQSGRRKEAAALETRFANSPAADPAAALRAAYLNFETGQYAATLALLEKAPKPDGNWEWLRLQGASHVGLGQAEPALAALRQYLQNMPYSEAARAELAQAQLQFGRYQEAVATLEEGVKSFDKSPQLALSLGVAYYGQRRFADAAQQFFRVIAIDPAVPQPYEFLVKMLDQLPEDLPRLRQLAERWHAASSSPGQPPSASPAYVLARVLEEQGEAPERVQALLQKAVAADPRHVDSWFALGALAEKQRRFAAAADAWQRCLALAPNRPETHFRLARVYDRLQQPAKAAAARQRHRELTQAEAAQPGAAKEGMNGGIRR